MIDLIPNTRQAYPLRLEQGKRFIDTLGLAARSCHLCFTWLHVHRSRSIPLLDFDIICGLSTSLAINNAIEDISAASDEFNPESFRQSMTGPRALGHLFASLDELCLPPGTAAELLDKKQRVQGKLSNNSRSLLGKIRTAWNAERPLEVLRRTAGSSDVVTLLATEIAEIIGSAAELQLLDEFQRKTIPFDALLSDAPEQHNVTAFHSVHRYLTRFRPKRTQNNFNDALNVAFAVRTFNAPPIIEGVRRVPFLISQTQVLHQFPGLEEWLDAPLDQNRPHLLYDRLYLTLSQGLLLSSSGLYRTAIDRAELLELDARHLSAAFTDLIMATTLRLGESAQVEESPGWPSYEWERLQHRYMRFMRKWSFLLEPPLREEAFDRAQYMNVLINPGTRRFLESESRTDFKKGIAHLITALRSERSPVSTVWDAVFSDGPAFDNSAGLRSRYTFSFVPDDGTPLSEIAPADLPKGALDSKEGHRRRIVVHPRAVTRGAIIAVDSWLDPEHSEECYVRIVWLHGSDLERVWTCAMSVLRSKHGQPDTKADCRLFLGDDLAEFGVAITRLEALPTEAMANAERIRYLDLRTTDTWLFADTQPLEELEMQIGLVTRVGSLGESVFRRWASAFEQSSIIRLDQDSFVSVVKGALSLLGHTSYGSEGDA
jgi:hypothetical protein